MGSLIMILVSLLALLTLLRSLSRNASVISLTLSPVNFFVDILGFAF